MVMGDQTLLRYHDMSFSWVRPFGPLAGGLFRIRVGLFRIRVLAIPFLAPRRVSIHVNSEVGMRQRPLGEGKRGRTYFACSFGITNRLIMKRNERGGKEQEVLPTVLLGRRR